MKTVRALAYSLVLALLLPAQAFAWCQMTTSRSAPTAAMPCVTEGIPLAWQRRCMSYAIFAGGSRDFTIEQIEDVLGVTFGTWLSVDCGGGATTGFDVRELAELSRCNLAQFDREGPNANTIIFVSDWAERGYDDAAFALTTVWHSTRTGEVFDVDMEINELRGPYGICPAETGCNDGTVDLQNVLTHEVGHFFTMAHTPTSTDATMFAQSTPGEVGKRSLHEDDIAGFCSIYPPGSLPLQCDFQGRNGTSLVCATDDTCGCAVPGAKRKERGGLSGLALLGVALWRRRTHRAKVQSK